MDGIKLTRIHSRCIVHGDRSSARHESGYLRLLSFFMLSLRQCSLSCLLLHSKGGGSASFSSFFCRIALSASCNS